MAGRVKCSRPEFGAVEALAGGTGVGLRVGEGRGVGGEVQPHGRGEVGGALHNIIGSRPAVDGQPELAVGADGRGKDGAAVELGAQRTGHVGRQRGEEGEPGGLLNLLRRGDVGVPVAAQAVRGIRDGDGNGAGAGRDAAGREAVAQGHADGNFPTVRGDIDFAAGQEVGAKAGGAADDEEFVIGEERAAVALEIAPRCLIVRTGLRHDVGREKEELVVGGIVGAVFGGAKVAAIEPDIADTGVITVADGRKIGREIGVHVITLRAGSGADIAGGQIPRGPNGLAQIVAVIQSFDGALDEIMGVVVGVGGGVGRIAQLHLERGINRTHGGSRREDHGAEHSQSSPIQTGFLQGRAR